MCFMLFPAAPFTTLLIDSRYSVGRLAVEGAGSRLEKAQPVFWVSAVFNEGNLSFRRPEVLDDHHEQPFKSISLLLTSADAKLSKSVFCKHQSWNTHSLSAASSGQYCTREVCADK